ARNGHKRQLADRAHPRSADPPSTRGPPFPTAPSDLEQPICILKAATVSLGELPLPKAARKPRSHRYRRPRAPVPGTEPTDTKASGRWQSRVGPRGSAAKSDVAAETRRGRAPTPLHTLARTRMGEKPGMPPGSPARPPP